MAAVSKLSNAKATDLRLVFDACRCWAGIQPGLGLFDGAGQTTHLTVCLHKKLPEDMIAVRALPGIQPVVGDWLRVDEAYCDQMALRRALLDERRNDVLMMSDAALPAAQEVLDLVLGKLRQFAFDVSNDHVTCPDGVSIAIDRAAPLATLGRIVQCDFCLHVKRDDQHVLDAAVLCFPASWRLAEKIGRPLTAIHDPVPEYDAHLARRVQRLFDGVRAGQPLWRFNQLWYEDPALFQPRSVTAPRDVVAGRAAARFFRAERQTILRLPNTGWIVFTIHNYVLRARDVPAALHASGGG